ncbi:hypothetical protein ACHAWF_004874 [Thalassiosira exigua]
MPTARRPPPLSAPLLSLLLSVATRGGARASTDPAGVAASMAATTAASAANLAATLATTFATTAVAASDPAVSAVDEAAATSATEPGEGTSTPGTATGAATGSTPPAAPDVLPALTPPPGGLRSCDEIVADAVPADVVAALLGGVVGDIPFVDEWPAALATHDVKVRKVCASCEEANLLWKAGGGDASADEVMPYCASGKFASGRTLSGLLFEPLDRTSADPPSGKVATTIYFDPGDPDPLSAPSEAFPSDPTSNLERASALLVPLAAASAGTYVVVPDGLGRGEDWAGTEGYMVKEAYQASTVPLLLKVRDLVSRESAERGGECTELDGRINLMGYSAGGYAAVAAAEAVGALGDGYEITYAGVGGAPLALSTAQMRAVVEMDASVYPFPFFAARLGHSYSSTNPDLANTVEVGSDSSVPRQDFASDEYLDPDDPTRNVRKWAEVGLSYEGMAPFLPPPPPVGKQSDLLNPSFVEMIVVSGRFARLCSVASHDNNSRARRTPSQPATTIPATPSSTRTPPTSCARRSKTTTSWRSSYSWTPTSPSATVPTTR